MWSLYLTDSRATALRYNHLRILPPNTVFNQDFSILFLKVHCQSTFMRCLKKASGIKKKKRERETQTKQNKQELWKGKQGRKKQDKGNKITSLKGVCVCAHPLCANTCVCLYIQRQFLNCVVWKPQGVPKAFSGGL